MEGIELSFIPFLINKLFGIACSPYVAIACIAAYLISGHHGIYRAQVIGDAKTATKLRDTGKSLGEI
tara:strand:- start:8211 stop:8411 length:201 start_codon:yes stop_codon:yes gene_type:complete